MTVQTVKLGNQKFVIVPEKQYRDLEAKAAQARPASKARRLTAQDKGDIAESRRRMAEPSIPLEAVRKRLGL